MTEPIQPKREEKSLLEFPSAPATRDAEDTGRFRWYEDLMDRILPKKEKAEPPE